MKAGWQIAWGVVCGLLAAGILLLASNRPGGAAVTLVPPPTPAPLVVHITGAVAQPGVYHLPVGGRLQDVVALAGGCLPAADTQAVNLAARLEDGQRVNIPLQAAPNAVLPAPAAPPEGTAAVQPTLPTSAERININTASAAELDTLPGIGPVTAAKIIAYRQAHGPFQTIASIEDVPGIGPVTLARIQDLITLGP